MVDTIDLQKIFSPISSTAKVKQVKQRHTNMQQRKFAQHLQEEGKRERSHGKGPSESEDAGKEKEEKKPFAEADNEGYQGSPDEMKPDDTTTGKLIDILA